MSKKPIKLLITCRTCGKKSTAKELVSLFQKSKQISEFPVNTIQRYHNNIFEIFENDGLPQKICHDCLVKFKSVNEFLEICVRSQNQLKADFLGGNLRKRDDYQLRSKIPTIEFKQIFVKKENEEFAESVEEVYPELFEKTVEYKYDTTKANLISKSIQNPIQSPPNSKSIKLDIDNVLHNGTNIEEIYYNYDDLIIHDDDNDKNKIHSELESSDEYFQDNYQDDFTIACQFCSKIVKNANELEQHELRKHKKKLYNKLLICEYCGDAVKNCQFTDHVKVVHEGTKPYKCNECARPFQTYRAFKVHMIKQHNKDYAADDKTTYPCKECNRVYLSKGVLQYHINSIHLGTVERRFKKRERIEPLDSNCNTTNDLEMQLFECDICKLKFRNVISLEQHRNNHNNEKYEHKYPCTECGRRFGRRDHLKYHIKLEHLKEKPHKCEQCNKTFVVRFQLNSHVKSVHSNDKRDKRVKCDKCDKTFYSKRYLIQHEKEMHSTKAQFVCIICNQEFFKHVHLLKHSKIHNAQENEKLTETQFENKYSASVEYMNLEQQQPQPQINVEHEIEMAVSTLVKNDNNGQENINYSHPI